ncbi:MAG: FAD-dependent oxidoreductase [Clostridiales bacterium]|nr:FAD-dependent oxidoreductase [Clostridiales bacterium]
MQKVYHKVDLCVVGGGLSGMCAAIAAARRGIKVLLMHDRPVLGGNASSEIRMWICGAHGDNNRETGILEEIELENRYRNPNRNYSIWDSILYEKIAFEENITMLLNCSCNDLEMDGDRIRSIKGWQLTTQTWHIVEAKLFADCSGDSILAPLSGAEFRMGREGYDEFKEDIQPEKPDNKTMGMSCLIQARETNSPQEFIPPTWANKYLTDDDLPHRGHDIHHWSTNFWWIELGGAGHSIYDTEKVRHELLKVAFGVWDHIKNRGDHGAENWTLDWVGFLPGKRESRRYIGDHILTQGDIEAGGKFHDIIAYGGWTLDDHHPGGIEYLGPPNIHKKVPSPFGIPYRSLYSKNIPNLLFAGRNISVSHAALSATRVMGTCATLGQAVGTASYIAIRDSLSPRGVYEKRIEELKQKLMDDDSYIPFNIRDVPKLTKGARLTASTGDPEPLRNGLDRPIGGNENSWRAPIGSFAKYSFDKIESIKGMRFIFDSDLNREIHNVPCSYPLDAKKVSVPKTIIKDFRIEAKMEDANWKVVYNKKGNYQRLVNIDLDIKAYAIKFISESTWGEKTANVFSWDIS